MSSLLVALAIVAGHPEAEAAFADYSRHPGSAYLSLAECPVERRDELENVLRFVVPSLSSKSHLSEQLPERVPGSLLLRLNLEGLGWLKTWEGVIAAHYVPVYRPDLSQTKALPLVVNGQWFAATIMDSQLTGDAQYRLLYGTPPKNAKEFLAHWQVNAKGDLTFGRVEGQSGVSVQLTRLIENLASGNRGYAWITYDSRLTAGNADPLENLTARPVKHDASELIAAIPKYIGNQRGTLQAYFLANAKGERQEKAPADIVTDSTGTRGVEIRNTLSCVACHEEGIRQPTLDTYRHYILSGARITTKDKATQQEIDRYLDSPIAQEISRNNSDYSAGVALCNGFTTQQNARAFRNVVRAWDGLVSPEQAALELYVTPEEWRLALGNYSRTYQLTGRLALMAQGQSISRPQWEANFALAYKVLHAWHAQ